MLTHERQWLEQTVINWQKRLQHKTNMKDADMLHLTDRQFALLMAAHEAGMHKQVGNLFLLACSSTNCQFVLPYPKAATFLLNSHMRISSMMLYMFHFTSSCRSSSV